MMEAVNGWLKGPLPPNTYDWGAVVPVGSEGRWFYFADFQGDRVEICGTDDKPPRILKPEEVAYYNNSITLPPASLGVQGRAS